VFARLFNPKSGNLARMKRERSARADRELRESMKGERLAARTPGHHR
jgi:hypothetical protein